MVGHFQYLYGQSISTNISKGNLLHTRLNKSGFLKKEIDILVMLGGLSIKIYLNILIARNITIIV